MQSSLTQPKLLKCTDMSPPTQKKKFISRQWTMDISVENLFFYLHINVHIHKIVFEKYINLNFKNPREFRTQIICHP